MKLVKCVAMPVQTEKDSLRTNRAHMISSHDGMGDYGKLPGSEATYEGLSIK